MQFAVTMRATDTANLPPEVLVALPKETFETFAAKKEDPRIKGVYPFAGERAGIFIIEADSADELQEVIGTLPIVAISRAEVHPISTVQGVLKTLQQMEQRIARMTPAGATRR